MDEKEKKKRKEREKKAGVDPTDVDVDPEDSAKEKKRKKQKRKVSDLDVDQEDDLAKEKKQRKKKKQVHYSSASWSSSSAESEYGSLCMPKLLAAEHFPADVTRAQVMEFFNNKPKDVNLRDVKDEEGVVLERRCLISFHTHSATREALKLKGKRLRGHPIYVARQGNDRDIVCVSGFNHQLPAKAINKELRKTFKSRGKVINIFLPTNTKTGHCLGFAYIYLQSATQNLYHAATIGAHQVDIRLARPKRCFQAEMEGTEIDVKKVGNPVKEALKKTLLPLHTFVQTSQKTFSWKTKRPDTTAEAYDQNLNDCWAVGLSRGYTVLRTLLEEPGPVLTRQDLLDGVDIAHQITGDGIDNIKSAAPFMSNYVKEMRIHHRPRGDDVTAFEDFERFLVELLKVSPVMVTVECVPSWFSFTGQGIYSPPDIECYMRSFEKFPFHCPLLTGYDIIDGIEVWELHESYGEDYGNDGFIWIERQMCDQISS